MVLVVAALLLSACGKKGPPRAPIRLLPSPAVNLAVRQIGDEVIITAVLPRGRTDGSPLEESIEVLLMRMPSIGSVRPGAVSNRYLQRQFLAQSQMIASFSGDDLRRAAPGGRFLYADSEPLVAARRGDTGRFMYSLLVVGADGKGSPLPVPVEIEVGEPPATPIDTGARVVEGEVRLTWKTGDPGMEARGEVARYNVYREAEGQARRPAQPLNPRPLSSNDFIDTTFSYGTNYLYIVRAVGMVAGPRRESPGSAALRVLPLDRFPPAAPAGLAAAVEGMVIRLYWFPNSEPDLGGYRIHRSRNPMSAPPGEEGGETDLGESPERIGEVTATDTSFTDATPTPGVRYHYSVSAIDDASPPNESPRSEERSEMLPEQKQEPEAESPAAEGAR